MWVYDGQWSSYSGDAEVAASLAQLGIIQSPSEEDLAAGLEERRALGQVAWWLNDHRPADPGRSWVILGPWAKEVVPMQVLAGLEERILV